MVEEMQKQVMKRSDPRQTYLEGPPIHLGRHIIAEFFNADFDALNEA